MIRLIFGSLIGNIVLLQLLSAFALFSTEQKVNSFVLNQFIYFFLAICIFIVISKINILVIKKISPFIYLVGLLLLIFVFLFGKVAMGAQRWIKLGPFNLQPGELIKIGLIMICSFFYSEKTKIDKTLYGKILFFSLLPIFFLLKQPDLGTSIIVISIGLGYLFVLGIARWIVISISVFSLLVSPIIWSALHDYQKNRILVFLNPSKDIRGKGYHSRQSLIALGAGGWLGKGWGKGTQSKLGFVPEQRTDFIFTIIGEDFGFLGVIFIIFIYMNLIFNLYALIDKQRSRYQKFVCLGVSNLVVVHVFCNIGMTIGIMPVVGIPLPLLSYGGSSVISFVFLLAISANRTANSYSKKFQLRYK